MKIYDDYGVRTPIGLGLGALAFIVATISTILFIPATGWALFAPFGCEVACTTSERFWIALVMICPIMLATSASLGFHAAFGRISASNAGFSLTFFLCAVFIVAVDFGYVS